MLAGSYGGRQAPWRLVAGRLPALAGRGTGQAGRRVGSAPIAADDMHCYMGRHGVQCPRLPPLPKLLPCAKWRAKDGEVAAWLQALSGASQAWAGSSARRNGRCHDRGPISYDVEFPSLPPTSSLLVELWAVHQREFVYLTPGTVKLWESPGRAGGLLWLLTKIALRPGSYLISSPGVTVSGRVSVGCIA